MSHFHYITKIEIYRCSLFVIRDILVDTRVVLYFWRRKDREIVFIIFDIRFFKQLIIAIKLY